MLNLDTHIVLFALTDALTAQEKKILSSDDWSISDIVVWEISKLNQLGRITFDFDSSEMIRLFSRLQIWPISLDVGRALQQMDFKSDPADEIIAATSVAYDIPLVTRDPRIRKSRIVPIAR